MTLRDEVTQSQDKKVWKTSRLEVMIHFTTVKTGSEIEAWYFLGGSMEVLIKTAW